MAGDGDLNGKARSLRERFKALARLERRSSTRHVPFVEQLQAADCGAACLTMVLQFLGHPARLEHVRSRVATGRSGASALTLIEAAQTFGLRGRAIRLDLVDIDYLEPGTILHWCMTHYVVLERIKRRGVHIVDPRVGRRFVSMEEFGKSFTGVALEFEPTEAFDAGRKGHSRTWEYARKILKHSRLLGRIIALTAFAQLLGLASPLLTGAIVDRVIPRGDVSLLIVLALSVGAMAVFGFVNSLLRAHLLLHLQVNLDLRLTLGFLEHMMRLPLTFFQVRPVGDLMMRLNSNSTIREILTSAAMSAILDGVMVFSYLIILLGTHFQFGCLIVGLGLLRVAIYLATRRVYRELMTKGLKAQADSSDYQIQMLAGIETLKSAGAERMAITHWSNLFVDTINVSLERGRLNAVVQSLLTALGTASSLVLLCYGAHLVLAGDLSLGKMLAMVALATGFLGPLSSLVSTALSVQTLGSYVERAEDVLATAPEQEETAREVAPRLRGKIEMRNVSFRYGDTGPLIVDGVSIDVDPGMKVGIVGASGSGKSTLARLLVGLVRPSAGEILYDGRVLSSLDLPSLRRQFGFVPQSPFLFSTSIRQNIALAYPDLPLVEVEHAAKMADIHGDIVDMPLRYETPVTGGGDSLSGGQRQRLALARALAEHPVVLVLDEGTSQIDSKSEARIHASLKSLRCTRIVITHRLSAIADSDIIFVMDQGKIIERGTHAELMRSRSQYAELFTTQAREIGHFHVDS
jgi:ATP-binding cassette subfamily B protein